MPGKSSCACANTAPQRQGLYSGRYATGLPARFQVNMRSDRIYLRERAHVWLRASGVGGFGEAPDPDLGLTDGGEA